MFAIVTYDGLIDMLDFEFFYFITLLFDNILKIIL